MNCSGRDFFSDLGSVQKRKSAITVSDAEGYFTTMENTFGDGWDFMVALIWCGLARIIMLWLGGIIEEMTVLYSVWRIDDTLLAGNNVGP